MLGIVNKARNTLHALFKSLYSWQKELDQKEFVGTILMDLSRAYEHMIVYHTIF